MGKWWTGYTSITGGRPCIAHSHGALWWLVAFWWLQPSMLWPLRGHNAIRKNAIERSLWGAECEIYALGTSSFSVSSQALWQHGPSQLALTTGLYSLIRGRKEPFWIGLAGFSLAFAI